MAERSRRFASMRARNCSAVERPPQGQDQGAKPCSIADLAPQEGEAGTRGIQIMVISCTVATKSAPRGCHRRGHGTGG
jgi:hypothetical protein